MIVEMELSHALYVSYNMREMDRKEIFGMSWSDSVDDLAMRAMNWPGPAWTCLGNDMIPVAIGGMTLAVPGVANGWCWGTDNFPKKAREITAACKKGMESLKDVYRVEAMSLDEHKESARWLKLLGFSPAMHCKKYGRYGEPYTLFVKEVG